MPPDLGLHRRSGGFWNRRPADGGGSLPRDSVCLSPATSVPLLYLLAVLSIDTFHSNERKANFVLRPPKDVHTSGEATGVQLAGTDPGRDRLPVNAGADG